MALGHRCQEAGITPSMGSVGDAYDNAVTESFFATLECELLDRHRFRTRTQARMAVFDYLEGFYNPRRRHSALGYLSPGRLRKEAPSQIRLSWRIFGLRRPAATQPIRLAAQGGVAGAMPAGGWLPVAAGEQD